MKRTDYLAAWQNLCAPILANGTLSIQLTHVQPGQITAELRFQNTAPDVLAAFLKGEIHPRIQQQWPTGCMLVIDPRPREYAGGLAVTVKQAGLTLVD